MAVSDPLIVRRLPGNIEAERAVLGAILLDNSAYNQAAALLTADDFQLDSHRRIFARMSEMADASRPIDLVTLAEELSRHNELEAVGGAVYISSLTDGIPRLANIEHYAVTVRDKSMLRRLVSICENVATQALEGTEDADTILDAAESLVLGLGERRVRRDFIHFRDIFRQSFESIDALH